MRDGKGAREKKPSDAVEQPFDPRLTCGHTHMHSRTQVDDEKERQTGRKESGWREKGRDWSRAISWPSSLSSRTEGKERNENRIEKK